MRRRAAGAAVAGAAEVAEGGSSNGGGCSDALGASARPRLVASRQLACRESRLYRGSVCVGPCGLSGAHVRAPALRSLLPSSARATARPVPDAARAHTFSAAPPAVSG